MKVKDKKWIRFRIYVVTAFFLLGFGTLWARAYQLQVLESDHLKAIARQGYIGKTKLPPKRGTIYDREGHELALSVEVASIYAHPRRVKEKARTARDLSRILEEKRENILRLLKSKRSFCWIKRKIAPDVAKKVMALDLKGVGVIPETRRYYPGREIAAHLIGFAGTDHQGLEGLEKKYDKHLKGPDYSLIHMRDALGRPFAISRPNPSGHGIRDLILTIDKDIQYKAQQALKSAVEKTKAKGGHCLVVDPMTGEILAMATVPEFNPNIFSEYSPAQWRNRSITDCFEPGSTIKAFLLSAALEESVVSPSTKFDCEQGEFKIGRNVVHDTHQYDVLSVSDIVVRSSNIGAIKIGKKLGYEKFTTYLKKLGFGSKTGIDLLGERNGFIRPAKNARAIDQATVFFGQGMTTTSLQLAMAMSAIANGGKLMRPYVVKSIVDRSTGNVEKRRPRVVRRVFSQKTAKEAARILEGVTGQDGTAPKAAIRGFRVAGKTGTSQKVDPKTKQYSRTKYVAVFVGFVPLVQPKLVILVVVDEPKGSAYGGVVAAPVFRKVGRWALNHLRVNPTKTPSSLAHAPEAVSDSHVTLLGKRGDNAGTEAQRGPGTNATSGEVGRIADELREGSLPEFSGLGMREVLKRGRALGLKVHLEGTGLAFRQEPSAGTPLQEVAAVNVSFRPPG
ncbi:MAG: transpeptidase family protein [Desulfobacteraceae bacterium]|nr:transpeptidase family protein [Desulfobacteraceae bacterium]